MMDIVRFVIAAVFMVCGLFILGVATMGLFRFHYVLNRIHASAKCDTLGSMLVLIALAILSGNVYTIAKIGVLIVFIWLTNPVAAHMIGNAEVQTNPYLENECEVIRR